MEHRFGFTADLRSWFYAFPVDREVAARYFTTFDTAGAPYAHVRGPMGFSHMPTLATSVAQAIVDYSIQDLEAYGCAWIDDVTIVAKSANDAEIARQRFMRIAAFLNIEVRELTDVSTSVQAVGIDFDLNKTRWRLLSTWVKKVLDSDLPRREALSLDRLLVEAGRAAWAAYALQIPLLPFADALRAAGDAASRIIAGSCFAETQVPISARAYEALVMSRALIKRNPWRARAPAPRFTVVSDASNSGIGLLYEHGARCVEQAVSNERAGIPSAAHITIREAIALRLAVCKPQHANAGVTCITDNSALFWLLRRGRAPRSTLLHNEIRELLRWCFSHRVTLFPLWISTTNMAHFGADEASRALCDEKKYVSKSRLRECVNHGRFDTATLTAGCKTPAQVGLFALPAKLIGMMFGPIPDRPASGEGYGTPRSSL
jgi:hypothetical protein